MPSWMPFKISGAKRGRHTSFLGCHTKLPGCHKRVIETNKVLFVMHRVYFVRLYEPLHEIPETQKNCIKNLATVVRSCNKSFVWGVWNHKWLLDMVTKKGHSVNPKPLTQKRKHIKNNRERSLIPEEVVERVQCFDLVSKVSHPHWYRLTRFQIWKCFLEKRNPEWEIFCILHWLQKRVPLYRQKFLA